MDNVVAVASSYDLKELLEAHARGHYYQLDGWIEEEVEPGVFQRTDRPVRIVVVPWDPRGM